MKQSFVAPFIYFWPIPFIASIIILVQAAIYPSSFWYLLFFVPYFPICTSTDQGPYNRTGNCLELFPQWLRLAENITSEVSSLLPLSQNELHSWNHPQPSENWQQYSCMPHWSHWLTTFPYTINLLPCPLPTQIILTNIFWTPAL